MGERSDGAPWQDPVREDTPIWHRPRSSLLGHPTRSTFAEPAYGSCRTYAKRTDRVSHRSLDGAEERAAHRLHRPSSLVLIKKNKNRRTAGATWLKWPPIRRKRVAPYGRYLTSRLVTCLSLTENADLATNASGAAEIEGRWPRVVPSPNDFAHAVPAA
jgi:hypothetical protein